MFQSPRIECSKGTLHVHKKHPQALSVREREFVEEVARLAASSLDAVIQTEDLSLRFTIDDATDHFLTSLLRGRTVSVEEVDLLKTILKSLAQYLEAQVGWLHILYEAQNHYTPICALGIDHADIPTFESEQVYTILNGRSFIVAIDGLRDSRIVQLFNGHSLNCSDLISQSQAAVLQVGTEKNSIAYLSFLVRSPHRISYNKIEQAAKLLEQVSELILVGRRFERNTKDFQATWPLALMGSMLSRIEHEIRAPIARLKGQIDFLCKPNRSRTDMKRMLEIMKADRTKLISCLDKLNYLVGVRRQSFTQINVAAVLRSAIRTLNTPGAIGLSDKEIPSRVVQIHGLENYLQSAFEFIIKNALQAVQNIDKKERVTVKLDSTVAENCRITIQDNGLGMNQYILEHALDPFFTTKPGGTGLGLAAANCIIRSHGGQLDIKTIQGQGTTVTILLPLKDSCKMNELGRVE